MAGRSVVLPWFSLSDYKLLKRLIKNDPDIPHTYNEWLDRATEQKAKLVARGEKPQVVVVSPEEFARYCQAAGQQCNTTMLSAFAVAKSSGRTY